MSRYRIEYEFEYSGEDTPRATHEEYVSFIAEDSKNAIDFVIKDIGLDVNFIDFNMVKLN